MCRTHNYYSSSGGGGGGGGGGEVVAGRLQELEALCESLSMEQLRSLNERMREGSVEEARAAIEEEVRGAVSLSHTHRAVRLLCETCSCQR